MPHFFFNEASRFLSGLWAWKKLKLKSLPDYFFLVFSRIFFISLNMRLK
jgi:hypothetical protein